MSKFDFSKVCENNEKFEQLFLAWYDAGKPEYTSDQLLSEELLDCCEEVDRIEDEPRRWSRWVQVILKIKVRFFSVGYDEGLTEMQENEYDDSEIHEVKPEKVVKVITEWEEI